MKRGIAMTKTPRTNVVMRTTTAEAGMAGVASRQIGK